MYCPRKDILYAWFYDASAIHVSQYWLWIYRFWITLTKKILVNAGLIEKNVVFKLLHIHPRGRSFRLIQLKLAAFCLSTEQNRTWSGRLKLIEFGNRTHRKVRVRLCSITEGEPIEQHSYRLGSIEFNWLLVRFRSIDYAGNILDNIAARTEWDRARMSYFRDWIATVHKRSISQWPGAPNDSFL